MLCVIILEISQNCFFFSWYPKDAYKAFMAVNIGLFSQYLYKFLIWSNDSGGFFSLTKYIIK